MNKPCGLKNEGQIRCNEPIKINIASKLKSFLLDSALGDATSEVMLYELLDAVVLMLRLLMVCF